MNDSSSAHSLRRPLLACVLLIAAVLAVFGQVCGHGFLTWDDRQHLHNNPHLNPVTWHGLGELWRRPYWGLYIPLSYTLLAAEARLTQQPAADGTGWTFDPVVFHCGNLLLHIGCVLLVFIILRRLFRHDYAACAAALLFALHPVQVESVAWVSETRGVLCGLFSLLAIWQYLCYSGVGGVPKSPAVHYGLATAALLMALLAKPAAVAVPLVVAVLEAGQPGRRRWRRMLLSLGPWFLLSAAWVVVTKLQQPDAPRWFVPPLWARPLLAGDALAFYVLKLVAPLSCGPDYGRTPRWVIEEGRFYLYAAWLLPAVLLIALACLRNRRVWLTAAGISIAWLVPVLGLVPFDYQRISTVADRYLYLALLGPAVALCWFLAHRWSRPAVALTAVVLCILGGLSFLQTAHWRNDAALFGHALRVNPHSAVAHHHLGILLAKQGEHSAAIARYRTALADHPQHAELHDSLGVSLAALEKTEEAVETLREAVRLAPGWADARYNLAKVLRREGHKKEAVEHLRKAVEAAPEHFLAHLDLGTALESLHRPDQARRHYRAVLRIRPDWPAAHFNLGNLALAELGGAARAAEHYRAALKFDPDYAKAHANLGMALFVLGKPREAIEHHRAALRIDPRLLPAQLGLAQALVAEGRHAEAEAEFRCALRLVPADSQPARQIREMLRQSQEHLSPVKSPQWKSLFDGKRLGRWEVVKEFDFINHGEVTVDQGNLVLGKGKPGTAVRFTGQFPKLDYEVSLEAMRVEGEDFFCGMTFPIGEKALTLIVGGWNGPVVGLSCIDDEPAVENETCLYMEFKQKRWYRIRLRVTAARITAWIDDEQIIDLPTEGRKLTIWFEPETVLPLGIATWKTKGALRNIRLRRLGQ